MNNYTNLSHLPHTLTIRHRLTNQLILKKQFKNEHDAVTYLNEAREYKQNKTNFSFVISGPNLYYSF